MVESVGTSPLLIHFLGASLLGGRISHAFGVSQDKENFKFRISGMAITFTVILLSSLYLLYSFFMSNWLIKIL